MVLSNLYYHILKFINSFISVRCRRRNCLRLRWIRWTLPSCRSWIRIRFGRSSLRCCPTRRCSTCRCPNLGCQQIRCPSSTCYWRSPNRRKDRRTSRTMGIQNQVLSNYYLVLFSEPTNHFVVAQNKPIQWPKSFQHNQLNFHHQLKLMVEMTSKEHQEDCHEKLQNHHRQTKKDWWY